MARCLQGLRWELPFLLPAPLVGTERLSEALWWSGIAGKLVGKSRGIIRSFPHGLVRLSSNFPGFGCVIADGSSTARRRIPLAHYVPGTEEGPAELLGGFITSQLKSLLLKTK